MFNKNYLYTTSPIYIFTDSNIRKKDDVDAFVNENNHLPQSKLIGTATNIIHQNVNLLVTNYHVVKDFIKNCFSILRTDQGILFYYFTDLLDQLTLDWVFDIKNDLAITVFPAPILKNLTITESPEKLV
ncbi:MAG: hypothetical protein HeimC3_34500 [Candidatus Heimdallarchaeota archaeon LC_3]|nr:MAG: hypothetical protein HeimC3_34500 [Candidatus Heimdallarchaeota archaeon LC_3]